MKKIICIGSSTKDVIFPISDGEIVETPDDLEAQRKIIFELGAKFQLTGGRHESIGGCAANVACGLARLGVETYCCTCIGDDETGHWLRSQLQSNGVNMDLVQVEENCQSDLSFILAHVPSEDRIIFSDRASNEKLEILPEEIKRVGAEWIFISSLNGNADEYWTVKLEKIMALAEKESIKLVFNPGQKNIKSDFQAVFRMIEKTEILIVNKDEAIEIVDKGTDAGDSMFNDEKFLAEKLQQAGPRVVVLTDGARGAWALGESGFFHVKAREEKVADTLGAGDAFGSGFVAAHLKGKSLEEGLQWGIINSSSVVQFYGAVQGLLKEDAIEE